MKSLFLTLMIIGLIIGVIAIVYFAINNSISSKRKNSSVLKNQNDKESRSQLTKQEYKHSSIDFDQIQHELIDKVDDTIIHVEKMDEDLKEKYRDEIQLNFGDKLVKSNDYIPDQQLVSNLQNNFISSQENKENIDDIDREKVIIKKFVRKS